MHRVVDDLNTTFQSEMYRVEGGENNHNQSVVSGRSNTTNT